MMTQPDTRAHVVRHLRAVLARGERKVHALELFHEVVHDAGRDDDAWSILRGELPSTSWQYTGPLPTRDPLVDAYEDTLHELQAQGLVYLRLQIPATGGRQADFQVPDHPVFPNHVVITRLGALAFQHRLLLPLEPEFARDLAASCQDLGDEIVARAEDAAACLRHGLFRPAVVMLGVMFEEAVAQLYKDCKIESKTGRPARNHGEKLDQIRTVVESVQKEFPDNFRRSTHDSFVELVSLVAERIRRDRNTAAHYGPGRSHHREVETLIENGIWALVELWKYRGVLLAIDP